MSKFDINSFIGTPDVVKNAVQSIDINKLGPYKNHCFKLYEGERLDDMVRSVQNYGIMIPIIVRNVPDSDTYEILSGHNRVNAAKIVGKKNVPALVKENLPDEFASVYVIESNAMKRGFKMDLLEDVITLLAMGEVLPDKNKDHALTGNWVGHRECHILPDWLLVYRLEEDVLVLTLTRTGTHSDLLGK